jgi:hypothetical protein
MVLGLGALDGVWGRLSVHSISVRFSPVKSTLERSRSRRVVVVERGLEGDKRRSEQDKLSFRPHRASTHAVSHFMSSPAYPGLLSPVWYYILHTTYY